MHWSNSDLHLILVVVDSWNHRVPWLGRDPKESLSPTPSRATQNSISAFESSVQMLIELYQPRAMITALGSLFLSPDHCLVKKLFVTLKFHITAPCHFPRALSLSKREELSAAPQLLCSEHTKGPQPLSYILSSTPFPIFVSLLWMMSHSFMSLYNGIHCCTHCSRWNHTAESKAGKPLPSLAGGAGQMHPWVHLDLLAARAHCWLRSNLPSLKNPGSLSIGLHSSLSSPSLYTEQELPHPMCRIWHLLLLKFVWLVIRQDLSARLV